MTKPKYHQSEIKDYLKCGLYHQFRYRDGLRSPSMSAATVGNTVDSTVNHILGQKIKGETTTLEEALDVASANFEAMRPGTVWDESPDQMKNSSMSIVKLFVIQVAPGIQPMTVQENFKIETEHYDLGGTFDYTDIHGYLGDIKTASPTRAKQHVVNGASQPAMYTYAYTALRGTPPKGFKFDIMTRVTNGSPQYIPILGVVTQADQEFFFQTVNAVHKAIQAGVAVPAPEGSWWCSKKWCPYWDRCKGRK